MAAAPGAPLGQGFFGLGTAIRPDGLVLLGVKQDWINLSESLELLQ